MRRLVFGLGGLQVTLTAAVLTMVGVLVTDLLYAMLDPRIRYR